MSQQEKHPFIEWVDQVEDELGWTDNKWTTNAGISASVLNNARNKGVIPKWDACIALAVAANKSPITAFRKAGLLPPGPDDKINFEDWQSLLEKMTDAERDEIWRIGQMKIEVRQKTEQAERSKAFKPGKAKK